MKTNFIYLIVAVAFTAFIIYSCEEEVTTLLDEVTIEDVQLVEDDAVVDALIENISQSVDQEILNLDKNGYEVTNTKSGSEDDDICRVITINKSDSTNFPKEIIIDFGDGCTTVINNDTLIKEGKIIVTVSDRYYKKNASREVTFEGFYVNDVKIEGTRTITNNGLNDNGNYTWTITCRDGKIIFNDTLQITFESDRTREWVNNGTITFDDDSIFIPSGSQTGTNILGQSFEKTITDTLKKDLYCPFFVSGEVEININDNIKFLVDFGDGTCDNKATIIKGEKRKEITLGFGNRFKH